MPTVTVRGGKLEDLLAEVREIELGEFIADCKRAAAVPTAPPQTASEVGTRDLRREKPQ